jgi:hypothetical protein
MGKTAQYTRNKKVNNDGTIEQDFLDAIDTEKVNAILAIPTTVDQSTPDFKRFELEIDACVEKFNLLLERRRLEREELEKEYGF